MKRFVLAAVLAVACGGAEMDEAEAATTNAVVGGNLWTSATTQDMSRSAAGSSVTSVTAPCAAGDRFQLAAQASVGSAAGQYGLQAYFLDASGDAIGSFMASGLGSPSGSISISTTAAPAGSVSIRFDVTLSVVALSFPVTAHFEGIDARKLQ